MNQKELEKEVEAIKNTIKRKRQDIIKLQNNIINLRKICDHNKTEIETYEREEYVGSGDFDYYTEYEETCLICGKVIRTGKQDNEYSEIIWN